MSSKVNKDNDELLNEEENLEATSVIEEEIRQINLERSNEGDLKANKNDSECLANNLSSIQNSKEQIRLLNDCKREESKKDDLKSDSPVVRDTIYRIIDHIVNNNLDDETVNKQLVDCKLLPNANCTNNLNTSTNGTEDELKINLN